MKKNYVAIMAMTVATAMLSAGLPQLLSAQELALTYTTPECSTVVRKGKTYGVYSTTILWANDGSSTADDYVSRNGMACQVGIITCTPTECSLPLTTCYQYLAQWVRVGFSGKAPTQVNLVNPMCPAT